MAKENLQQLMSILLTFLVLSSALMGFILIFYVAIHDEVGVTLVNLGENLAAIGVTNPLYVTAIENILVSSENFPTYLDILFLGLMFSFYISVLISAYYLPRVGYFSALGYSTFGVMMMLFILSIYLEISNWLTDLLFSAVPSITPSIPYFVWYGTNVGVINLFFFCLCIVVSVVHLDFSQYKSRKKRDFRNTEI